MRELTQQELTCAQVAVRVVTEAGGFITFDSYDRRMVDDPIIYFAPLNWCWGWGNPIVLKANQDKLCAFAAVHAGLLVVFGNGYALPQGKCK